MAQQPNVNPTPKARFQSAPQNITAHHAMIERDSFDKAADAALLQYCADMAQQTRDGNSAMAMGFKLQGALEYLQTLKLLEETGPTPVARKDLDNLPNVSHLQKQ